VVVQGVSCVPEKALDRMLFPILGKDFLTIDGVEFFNLSGRLFQAETNGENTACRRPSDCVEVIGDGFAVRDLFFDQLENRCGVDASYTAAIER
jgi:hypothetical protein